MNTHSNKQSSRNPIARSFGAGINQGKVIPNKSKDRRACRRVFVIGEE